MTKLAASAVRGDCAAAVLLVDHMHGPIVVIRQFRIPAARGCRVLASFPTYTERL